MTRGGAGALVAAALVAAVALRAGRLEVRPMHHDEANQAVKFGALLERGEYRYDRRDHHGPTLYYLTLPSAWLGGRHTLAALDETTLRRVPAAFGIATILLLPLLSAAIGRTAVAAAAILTAVSPAMVFYSRMFIQEALLACFTLAFLIALGRMATGGGRRWWLAAGAAAGFAVATKETSAIVLPAAIAACAIAWWSLGSARPPNAISSGRWHAPAVIGLAAAAAIGVVFYSSFFSEPAAVLEPFRGAGTYVARGFDPASHAHPWHYYLRLLTYTSSGGLRWSEGLVVALAIVGAAGAWRRSDPSHPGSTFWARYLALDVAIAAAAFSAIPYKTPWNLLPFYAVALVLAGVGFATLVGLARSRVLRGALAAALALGSLQLGWQAWRAAVTYASDPRNPYVYAHTVPDAVRMAARILDLAALHADGLGMQVSVIAPPYEQWPLPWYLRTMPNVGYWTELAGSDRLRRQAGSNRLRQGYGESAGALRAQAEDPAPPPEDPALQAPVIVSSIEGTPALDAALGDRYVSEFYGLRPEVPLALYIERGLWDRFLATVQ